MEEIQQRQQEERSTNLLAVIVAIQERIEIKAKLDLPNPLKEAHQPQLQIHRLAIRPLILHPTVNNLPRNRIKP